MEDVLWFFCYNLVLTFVARYKCCIPLRCSASSSDFWVYCRVYLFPLLAMFLELRKILTSWIMEIIEISLFLHYLSISPSSRTVSYSWQFPSFWIVVCSFRQLPLYQKRISLNQNQNSLFFLKWYEKMNILFEWINCATKWGDFSDLFIRTRVSKN